MIHSGWMSIPQWLYNIVFSGRLVSLWLDSKVIKVHNV